MKLDQLKDLQKVMQKLDAKTSSKNKYDHLQFPKNRLSNFINTKVTGMEYTDNILDLLQRGNIISITNEPHNIEDLKINDVNLKKALILINEDLYQILMINKGNNNKIKEVPTNTDFDYIFHFLQMTDLFVRDQTLRIIYCLLMLSQKDSQSDCGEMIFTNYKPSDYWDLWLEINNIIRKTFTPPTDDQLLGVDSPHIQKAMSKLTKLGIVGQVPSIITINRYKLFVYLINVKNILVLNS